MSRYHSTSYLRASAEAGRPPPVGAMYPRLGRNPRDLRGDFQGLCCAGFALESSRFEALASRTRSGGHRAGASPQVFGGLEQNRTC